MNRPGTLTRRACVFGLATLPPALGALGARRPPPEIAQQLPDARLSGHATLRFLGLAIYDIRLWSAAPLPRDDIVQQPFGLELEYARDLAGAKIAQRSLDEMQRIGKPTVEQAQRWLATLRRLFPDVAAGDRLTGVNAAGRTLFFHNARALGSVEEADFSRLFFGIWLAPATSEPRLREQLLGLGTFGTGGTR